MRRYAARMYVHKSGDDNTVIGKLFALMIAAFALTACGTQTPFVASQSAANIERSYDIESFTFTALPDLTVSEAEGYYPFADVVWRGESKGARIPQIGAMFETAAARNSSVLAGDVPVAVQVRLVRFHGVTDRTRYSVGGNYNIVFDMTVTDARTGTLLEPTRRIVGNLDAPGGSRAVSLERSGQTQTVRVTSFLTSLLRAELS